MINNFKDKATEDIFNGKVTKTAMKLCPKQLWRIASRKLDQLDSVLTLDELRVPPGNRLESLSGDRKGQCCIRINDQYQRINEIVNGKRGITPSTALRLAKVFGVSSDFWMNIQLRWDLYFANQSESEVLKGIKPLSLSHLATKNSNAKHSAGH